MLRRHSERRDYNRQVTEARQVRPHGGYWIWLLLVVLGATAIMVAVVKDFKNGIPRADSETENAMRAAQRFIKEDLGANVVPRFSPRNWTKVDLQGDQYVISGWVEAIQKSGLGAVTYDYTCTVFRNLDGEWYPSDLDLRAQ